LHEGMITLLVCLSSYDYMIYLSTPSFLKKGVVMAPLAAPRNDEERSCPCGNVESQ
jgi:hypothetical protein